MVSTRHHPRPFPEPATPTTRASPTKTSTSTRRRASSTTRTSSPPESPVTETNGALVKSSTSSKSPGPRKRKSEVNKSLSRAARGTGYVHKLDPVALTWLIVSVPLVIWDIGYVMGRPHTMPGGKWHSPIYSPYAIYSKVDLFYGTLAWESNDGFTAAQSLVNVLETLMYLYYVGVMLRLKGTGILKFWQEKFWTTDVLVSGDGVALAVLVFWSSCVMTFSKTVLYGFNDACSGFAHTKHNNLFTLITVFIIPDGLWCVFPAVMGWRLGKELLAAMNAAGGRLEADKED